MAESFESTLQSNAFPFMSDRHAAAVERRWEKAPTNLPKKRSLIACAFLLAYAAVFVAVGYAGITVIGYAWSAIFQ
jgi:hypothetical protein